MEGVDLRGMGSCIVIKFARQGTHMSCVWSLAYPLTRWTEKNVPSCSVLPFALNIICAINFHGEKLCIFVDLWVSQF